MSTNAGKRLPNYVRELLKMDFAPGTGTLVTVKHDNWCALLKAGGRCDCNPEIVCQPATGGGA